MLSNQAKYRLEVALTDEKLAKELAFALENKPTKLSKELKYRLEVALANEQLAKELIKTIESSVVIEPSQELKRVLEIALTSTEIAQQFISEVVAPIEVEPEEPIEPEAFVESATMSPISGDVPLAIAESLVLTITIDGEGFEELEIDHSLAGVFKEFSVYANESNPYGDSQAEFEAAGVEVTYANKTFTIDLGLEITNAIRSESSVSFYHAVRDAQGAYLWGSMSPATPENTTTYVLVDSEEVEG